MITLMKPETTLYYVRKQVGLSHFAHAPRDFCFLFKGHALDPSVEDKMRAMKIAVRNAYTGNEVRVERPRAPTLHDSTACAHAHALDASALRCPQAPPLPAARPPTKPTPSRCRRTST